MNVMRGMLAALLVLTLQGCANWNGIYRTKTISTDRPKVITVDAKQREILMVPDREAGVATTETIYKDGQKLTETKTKWGSTGNWRICAEASPDVFSVLAASASAALKADVAGKSGELQAAFAITESASSIERTQTINLLRESFYRTCERYMSGAIGKSAFVVQAGRDWKAMIAILAIEQLTRAARPGPTVLVAGGTSATVTTPQDWVRAIETAQADERAADANVTAVAEATKTTREDKCDTGDATAIADCKKKKADAEKQLADATLRAKEARARLDAVLASAKNGGGAGEASALTTAAVKSDLPLKEGERSASDLATVSADVRLIAMRALEADEMQLFCIQKLEDTTQQPKEKLFDACLTLLAESARFDAAKLLEARNALDSTSQQLFNKFWSAVLSADGSVSRYLLEAKIDRLTTGRPLTTRQEKVFKSLRSAINRDAAWASFSLLSADDKKKLALEEEQL